MRLLIFGAGVLGTFYATELQACGHDVTILARGRRAVQIRDYGLVVQGRGRRCLRARASVIETLGPEQSYDYVLVLVRNDQVESVLPSLAANKATPSLVFMFNNLAGPQRLIDVLGRERVVLGFPGAAGERTSDGTVVATVLPALIQKTTVGELDGLRTPRVRLLAAALQEAGVPTAISSNMDAWLKTHVALVSPISDAFYAAGSDLKILAASRFQVFAVLRSIRKAFTALRAQGPPVTPARLRSVELLPAWLLVVACQWALRTSYAELHATVQARRWRYWPSSYTRWWSAVLALRRTPPHQSVDDRDRMLGHILRGHRRPDVHVDLRLDCQAPTASPLRSLLPWRWGLRHPGKSPLVTTALHRLSERQTPVVPAPSARSPAAARAPRVRSRAVAAMAEAV